METSNSSPKIMINSSTKTDHTSNKGKGIYLIDETKRDDIFPCYNDTPTPLYRENLNKVFNEEFIAEASRKELKPIIDSVIPKNWDNLKIVNPLCYKIRRDLSVTPDNCLVYDHRMVIPNKLKEIVLDAIHNKHPGQVDMLAFAKLV